VGAVVTDENDAIRVFADCIHASRLLLPFPQDVQYGTDGTGEWFPTMPRGCGARRRRRIDEGNVPRRNLGLHAASGCVPR
jgi:hypothetical protein